MKKLIISLFSCMALACMFLVDFSSIANAKEVNKGSGWVADCKNNSEVSCTLECSRCHNLFTAPYTVSGPVDNITGSCPICNSENAGNPTINPSIILP